MVVLGTDTHATVFPLGFRWLFLTPVIDDPISWVFGREMRSVSTKIQKKKKTVLLTDRSSAELDKNGESPKTKRKTTKKTQ